MSQDLKILIQAKFDDSQKAINDLNSQLVSIQNKMDSLQLKVNIDPKVEQTINKFSQAMESHKMILGDLNKSYKEHTKVVKEDEGRTTKVTQQYLKSGEIIEKTTETIDKRTKAIKDQVDETSRLMDETEKLGQLQKVISRQNAKGEYTGGSERFKDGSNDITYNYNKKGEMTSTKTVENIDKENKATEDLRRKKEELIRTIEILNHKGILTNQTFTKMSGAIDTRSDIQELNKLNNAITILEKNAKRKTFFGENVGASNNLKDLTNATEKQIAETLKANNVFKHQEILASSLDRVTGRWTVTIKENSRQQKTFSGIVDKTTGSIYKQKEAISDVAARNLGMLEQFKIAASRVNISCPLYQ
jgi:hypothetical protein